MTQLPPKSKRTFSKRILIANMVMVWGVVIYALYLEAVDQVISPALNFAAILFGLYTGVGYLDFRNAINMASGQDRPSDYGQEYEPPYEPDQEPPVEPEAEDQEIEEPDRKPKVRR